MPPPYPLSTSDQLLHLENLDLSGFTCIPHQLPLECLEDLRDIASRASDAYIAAWREGLELERVSIVDTPSRSRQFDRDPNARAAHLWGDAALQLLDHQTVHQLAAPAMGRYSLHDVVANTLRPAQPERPFAFHRDFEPGFTADGRHTYLWFFFLLDDFTTDNGSTWVVPGTHAFGPGKQRPLSDEILIGADPLPGRKQQVLGAAGDLLVLNPACLHSGGINRTQLPRRTLNVRLTQPEGAIVMDHWLFAGPERRAQLGPQGLRLITPPPGRDLARTWAVLPSRVPA